MTESTSPSTEHVRVRVEQGVADGPPDEGELVTCGDEPLTELGEQPGDGREPPRGLREQLGRGLGGRGGGGRQVIRLGHAPRVGEGRACDLAPFVTLRNDVDGAAWRRVSLE